MASRINLWYASVLVVSCHWLALSRAAAIPRNADEAQDSLMAPEPMLDMYYCWEEAGDLMEGMENFNSCKKALDGRRSTKSHNTVLTSSDVVNSFVSIAIEEHSLLFEVNCTLNTSLVTRTEVRVFHEPVSMLQCGGTPVTSFHLKLKRSDSNGRKHTLDRIDVPADYRGWLIFDNLTMKIADWEAGSSCSHELHLEVSGACHHETFKHLGLLGNTHPNKKPLIMLYSSSNSPELDEGMPLPDAFLQNLFNNATFNSDQEGKRSVQSSQDSHCHLEKFKATFNEIGYGIIFHPKTINLNRCTGGCRYPLYASNSRDLHATLLAAYAKTIDDDTFNPSCVPTAYNKTNLLYGSTNHQTLEKARVTATACGCR